MPTASNLTDSTVGAVAGVLGLVGLVGLVADAESPLGWRCTSTPRSVQLDLTPRARFTASRNAAPECTAYSLAAMRANTSFCQSVGVIAARGDSPAGVAGAAFGAGGSVAGPSVGLDGEFPQASKKEPADSASKVRPQTLATEGRDRNRGG